MKYAKYILKGLHPTRFKNIFSKSLGDFAGRKYGVFQAQVHLKAAMEWLSFAQRQNKDGGVSALYSLFEGWAPSYVETTGYIIPTFFNYAELSKDASYRKSAIEMSDFELGVQLESGAFPGAGSSATPIVFNTGQVLFGICRAFEETKDEKYLNSAKRAASWLVSVMDADGCWRKHEYLNHVHTYNTRTAWALLCAHRISGDEEYKNAASRNINWAISQQHDNGWFENNAFYPKQEPLVHTIAYSIRGILEAAIYLKRKKYLESAVKAASALADCQEEDGSLKGSFRRDWKSSARWSCLTGNSQMSIIWQKLHAATKEDKFKESARKSNEFMKAMQNLEIKNPTIRGAIPGAYPIYGWYAPFCYPNWAAKFFADALMMEIDPKRVMKIV